MPTYSITLFYTAVKLHLDPEQHLATVTSAATGRYLASCAYRDVESPYRAAGCALGHAALVLSDEMHDDVLQLRHHQRTLERTNYDWALCIVKADAKDDARLSSAFGIAGSSMIRSKVCDRFHQLKAKLDQNIAQYP